MGEQDKVLHVMMDTTFIDYFIEQSEQVAPGRSVYWVIRGDINSEVIIVKSKLITPINWSNDLFPELSKKANKYKKIIFHSFFPKGLNNFVKKIRKDIFIVWFFWGGDGYKYSMNDRQWYLPQTQGYRTGIRRKNHGAVGELLSNLKLKWLFFKESSAIRNLIKRVDLCVTWVKYDYEMVLPINRKMKWANYSYFATKDIGLDIIDRLGDSPNDIYRIWLGNSATDTNNHFDALHYLKKINWKGTIWAPLSYGDSVYRSNLIEYGKKEFGENFIPILEYLPIAKYYELMNNCTFVWMNHIRQQGAGNILSALYMQKAVIMNSNNNLYKSLKDWDIKFAELELLKNPAGFDFTVFAKNREIVKKGLSHKENTNVIKLLYNDQDI